MFPGEHLGWCTRAVGWGTTDDCRGSINLVRRADTGARFYACDVHRLDMVKRAGWENLPWEDVMVGDWCALNRDLSGADHRLCTPDSPTRFLRSFIVALPPQPEQHRVWLCDRHAPTTGGVVHLPAGHPVLTLNDLRLACSTDRWDTPSPQRMALGLAERRVFGLADDAPGSDVIRATGLDTRATYRWALPIVTAFNDLTGAAAAADVAATVIDLGAVFAEAGLAPDAGPGPTVIEYDTDLLALLDAIEGASDEDQH